MKKFFHYTKVYVDGTKMIFQFHHSLPDNMANVVARCDENGDDYHEDDSVYIGYEGTSIGAIIRDATEEEINLLDNPILS